MSYLKRLLTMGPMVDSRRRHIFRDLRPYVCTFEDCQNPDKQYITRHDWIYHETQMHRRQWTCVEHKSNYPTQDLFIEHIKALHSKTVSASQLSSLVELSERPIDKMEITPCPLCPEERHLLDLQNHLAQHLESIALFILSTNSGEDDQEDGKSDKTAGAKVASRTGLSNERHPSISTSDTIRKFDWNQQQIVCDDCHHEWTGFVSADSCPQCNSLSLQHIESESKNDAPTGATSCSYCSRPYFPDTKKEKIINNEQEVRGEKCPYCHRLIRETLPINPPLVLEQIGQEASKEVETPLRRESPVHLQTPASVKAARRSGASEIQSEFLGLILSSFNLILAALEAKREDLESNSNDRRKGKEFVREIKYAQISFEHVVPQLLEHSNLTREEIQDIIQTFSALGWGEINSKPLADQVGIKEAYGEIMQNINLTLNEIRTRVTTTPSGPSNKLRKRLGWRQGLDYKELKTLSSTVQEDIEKLRRLIDSAEAIRSSQSLSQTKTVLIPPNLRQNMKETRKRLAEMSEILDLMLCNEHDHRQAIHLPLQWAAGNEEGSKELFYGLVVWQLLLDFAHKDRRVTAMVYIRPQERISLAIPMPMPICEHNLPELELDAVQYSLQHAKYSFSRNLHVAFSSLSSKTESRSLWDALSRDQSSYFTRRKRYAVAVCLAESFLQIHSTPWVSNLLQKKDVILSERPGILLHVSTGSTILPANEEYNGAKISDIQTLGIRFVELCFGKCIEHVPHREKTVAETEAAISTSILDFAAAVEWSREIIYEAGSDYAAMVDWCLRFDNENINWESEFWEHVILPLKTVQQHFGT